MAFRVEQAERAERDILNILGSLIAEQAGRAGLRWFEGLEQAIGHSRRGRSAVLSTSQLGKGRRYTRVDGSY